MWERWNGDAGSGGGESGSLAAFNLYWEVGGFSEMSTGMPPEVRSTTQKVVKFEIQDEQSAKVVVFCCLLALLSILFSFAQ